MRVGCSPQFLQDKMNKIFQGVEFIHEYVYNLNVSLSILTWPLCISRILNIGIGVPYPELRLLADQTPYLLGYVLHYISSVRPPQDCLWFSYHIIPLPSSYPYRKLPLSTKYSVPIFSVSSPAEFPAKIFRISSTDCSHNLLDRRSPRFLSTTKHKSMI